MAKTKLLRSKHSKGMKYRFVSDKIKSSFWFEIESVKTEHPEVTRTSVLQSDKTPHTNSDDSSQHEQQPIGGEAAREGPKQRYDITTGRNSTMSTPNGSGDGLPHFANHYDQPSGRPGGNTDDDLNDLMEVFDFFEVFDGSEAEDLESSMYLAGGAPAKDANGQVGRSSLTLATNIQQRKMAANSPQQSIRKEPDLSGMSKPTPFPPIPGMISSYNPLQQMGTQMFPTFPNQMMSPVPPPPAPPLVISAASSVSGSPVPSIPAKSKRGRKKKEDTLARISATDQGMDVDMSLLKKEVNPVVDEEKERLRRENNKQSARNSRKKKKEYVIVLGESISGLTKEVQMLRQELAHRSLEDEHREKLSCLGRSAFLQALESHGPVSHKRRLRSAYQFENLTRNVAPPHTRFLLWAVARRATEPDSAAARTWQEVTSIMGLQPEQAERLSGLLKSKKATDTAAAEERDKLQFVFSTIQRMRANMEQLSMRVDAHHKELMSVLTPEQQAVLHQYIEEKHCEEEANRIAAMYVFGGDEATMTPDLQRVRGILAAPHVPSTTNLRGAAQQEEMKTVDFLLGLQ